jgi:hypothetical protein
MRIVESSLRPRTSIGLALVAVTLACSGESTPTRSTDQPSTATGGAMGPGDTRGASGTRAAGSGVSAGIGAAPPAGGSRASGIGGSGPAGNNTSGSGVPATGEAGAGVDPGQLPASCAEAAGAYKISATSLDASLVPQMASRSWAGNSLQAQVAVHPENNRVYVGFNRSEGGNATAAIAAEGGAPDTVFSVPGAVLAGVAATRDGVGALVFDPNASTDMRVWAAVVRFGDDRSMRFMTELFRSPNLDDVGTKGGPTSGRLGYIAESDQLVAYFGHTQRYDDGVRHQGGYLATLNAAGMQQLVSGWFGSHNLDQRLLIDAGRALVLGLGDAFPEGIFYSPVANRPRTNVIYPLAAAGNGATNGQLGGMVAVGDSIVIPFITNRSVPQDLDAGKWPDIDETISMQIRTAAANGVDLGLLTMGKTATPAALQATWLQPQLAMGGRLGSLKSARYGKGELILLLWGETTGTSRNATPMYFTMVIDRAGAVCQPKTPLDPKFAVGPGDDIVNRPDGAIVWGNTLGGRVQVVTLVP